MRISRYYLAYEDTYYSSTARALKRRIFECVCGLKLLVYEALSY
jgi:hypothetical protein